MSGNFRRFSEESPARLPHRYAFRATALAFLSHGPMMPAWELAAFAHTVAHYHTARRVQAALDLSRAENALIMRCRAPWTPVHARRHRSGRHAMAGLAGTKATAVGCAARCTMHGTTAKLQCCNAIRANCCQGRALVVAMIGASACLQAASIYILADASNTLDRPLRSRPIHSRAPLLGSSPWCAQLILSWPVRHHAGDGHAISAYGSSGRHFPQCRNVDPFCRNDTTRICCIF